MMSRITNYEAVAEIIGHWLHRAQVSLLTGAFDRQNRSIRVSNQVSYPASLRPKLRSRPRSKTKAAEPALCGIATGLRRRYVNMFEGPVTGNIPEVLDNGEVTDGTHVTAGQLALALTPYAQVTDLAVNTAASGNNAAAIQSLDDRAEAQPQSQPVSDAAARQGARQPVEAFPRNASARRACHRRSYRSLTRQPAEAPGGIEPPKRRYGEQRNA